MPLFRNSSTTYTKKTGQKVKLSFGSSGNLANQIRNGAPFDIFFSADEEYAQQLIADGLASNGTLYRYAVGRLVLWVPANSPLDLSKLGMKALLDPSVQKIAIANPAHAPYGRAAEAALRHYGIYDQVSSRLVLGENVSQAAQFVESGNAQAGLIALSHALAPALKDKGRYWTVPLDAYPTLNQAVVVLSRSKQQDAARRFLEFLRSPEATSLLATYGFSLPARAAFQRRKSEMNWEAFWLTVRLAAIVSTLLIAIGIPIAYWLTYSRWRWKFLVEAAVALPIVLPPTVLGFYVLVALGSRSPLGRWWESLTGHTLAFTFEGLVIGSLLYSLPFAVQPFAASFGAVDSKLLRASASLGHSPVQTFRRIVLPLSKAGLVTGFALSFAHTLGEFGVVLMVGGNIPGVTRTISIDIYDQVQTANYSSANQTALVLLVISFAVLSVVYALNRYGLSRRPWAVGPWR